MSEQQYSNLASSTLASAYTAGDTTLTLQSGTGSLFPVTGDFTVAIDSPPSFFLYCTARATDVITVNSSASEGTTAGNKPIGTTVTEVITAGVLNNIRSDMNKFGFDTSISSSGMHLGDRYDSIDQPYYYIYGTSGWRQFTSGTGSSGTSGISGSSGTSALGFTSGSSGTSGISGSSGTSGISGGGGSNTPSDLSSFAVFSTLDEGSSTILDLPHGYIQINSTATAVYGIEIPNPSLFSISALLNGISLSGEGAFGLFVGSSSSSKSIKIYQYDNPPSLNIQRDTGSSISSTPISTNIKFPWSSCWFKIDGDGTNIHFSYSVNGVNWVIFFTELYSDWVVAPTHYGVIVYAASSQGSVAVYNLLND